MAFGKCFSWLCRCRIFNFLAFYTGFTVVIIFHFYMKDTSLVTHVKRKLGFDTRIMLNTFTRYENKSIQPETGFGLNCKPKTHIVFIKTHKTGSSTVTNILNRFGDSRNLTFALPRKPAHHYKFGWPKKFRESYLEETILPKLSPDILCNHARFSRWQMKAAMPEDSVYITILRDPVATFVSTFESMDVAKLIQIKGENVPKQIENFFHNIVISIRDIFQKLGVSASLLRNGQLFDLGFQVTKVKTQKPIFSIIKKLDQIFDHVLIAEYFDASLILMRRKFCWDLADVVYLKLMEREEEEIRLSTTVEDKIRRYTAADGVLYEYFKQKLLKEISKQGQDFFDEVDQLQEINRRINEKCIASVFFETAAGSRFSKIRKYLLRGDVNYRNKMECCRLVRDEKYFLDYHRLKQQFPTSGSPLDFLMGCRFEKKQKRKRI